MERIVNNSRCQEKNYTPHSLWHGYGSILLSMGTDIKIVSELLGHSDVSFTYNVYIGIFDRDKHDAVMKLNQIYVHYVINADLFVRNRLKNRRLSHKIESERW